MSTEMKYYTNSWLVEGLRHISARGIFGWRRSALLRESFWGILARIYESFGENHEKFRTARSTSATRYWNSHFPSTTFERRTIQLLVVPRTDSLTSMPFPPLDRRNSHCSNRIWYINNWLLLLSERRVLESLF